jgi:dihydroxyacetone kinase-like predicted kinase
MKAALTDVQTGEVTVAVRDVRLGDLDVAEGDFIGLKDDELVTKGSDPEEVALALLAEMEAEQCEIITVYWGEPVDMEAASALESRLIERHPEQEIELVNGGQPHYHYILSVE